MMMATPKLSHITDWKQIPRKKTIWGLHWKAMIIWRERCNRVHEGLFVRCQFPIRPSLERFASGLQPNQIYRISVSSRELNTLSH